MIQGLRGLCALALAATPACRADRADADKPPAAVVAAFESAAPAGYPVTWMPSLELASAADARARLSADAPASFGALETRAGARASPANCLRWAELHANGFEPVDGLAEQADNRAKLRCGALQLIERAQPAAASFVRALGWNQAMLAILPPAIATAFDEDTERAVAAANVAGKSFAAWDPRARVKPNGKTTLEIVEGDRQTMIVLYPLVWGDFDDDRVDDLALAVVNGASLGTYSYTRLLTVTRPNRAAVLRVTGTQ